MPDGLISFEDGIADFSRRQLPPQNYDQILIQAQRWARGTDAMRLWAETGRKCVDYFEGKQWKEADLRKLEQQGRPALTINRLRPLVNLVMGYHLNNRTDIRFMPGNDGTGNSDLARALTHTDKNISEANQVRYVDAEVFLDGALTGRGYYDARMDFEANTFGEAKWKAKDPFSIVPDADADEYDSASWGHVMEQRWTDADEIRHFYGPAAENLVRPFIAGASGTGFTQMPSAYGGEDLDTMAPWRTFSGGVSENGTFFQATNQGWYDWVDPYRKNIRLLDIQHFVRTWRWHFVDLETGDRSPVPDNWTPDRAQRAVAFARANGQQLMLQNLSVRRLRWTHMAGDVVLFDEWSPYETPTIIPFFPYFRRGQTRGMVHDLLDPQDEVNVRRSARLNITGRASNGGWQYAKGSLDAQMKAKLDRDGGKPGFNMEYDTKGGTLPPPTQIQPGANPIAQRELEHEAASDLEYIAGINKSALGEVDGTNMSGRAVLARQQQTVIGLEGMRDNYHRSAQLRGRKQLELIQRFYTEERIIRVLGENGQNPLEIVINQATAQGIVNNVSIGRYAVTIDETSLTDSFLAGQFQELMELRKLGVPIPDSHLIDASSYGRKEELKVAVAAMAQAQAAMGVVPGAEGGDAANPANVGPGGEPGGPASISGPAKLQGPTP